MPKNANPHQISKVHIADGFHDDCDEFIHRCSKYSVLDYKSFCGIWKDMNFGFIYQGRTSGAEIAELSEEVILIAKHYMVKPTDNFEESVAGLFLVYGLLNLQPFERFAWLRIVPDDIPAINRIEVVARREKRLDVLYILGTVLVRWSQYHAAERERGIESSLRKYLEGYTSIDKLGVRPKGVFYRQNEELDLLRELGAITRQYVRAKNSVLGERPTDPSLQFINEDLAEQLNSSLKKIIVGVLEEHPLEDTEDSDSDDYEKARAIKKKAMKNVVDPMKHLTGIEHRKSKSSPEKSPQKKKSKTSPKTNKSDLKPATGNIKRGSPIKPIAGSPSKRSPFRKKVHLVQESDTETELNLAAFDKEVAKEPETINLDDSNINIQTLPVIIKTNNGRPIEIEFIDNSNNTENQNTPEQDKIVKTFKGKKLIPVPIEEVPLIQRKREKRDIKRTLIQTKFKRMGMLSVANFKEGDQDSSNKKAN